MTAAANLQPPHQQPLSWVEVAILLLVPLSFGFLATQMGQDANFDLRNYHVYVAESFLHGRWKIDAAPAYHASYHNPLLYVPIHLGMLALPPKAFVFGLGTIQGANFVPLYYLSKLVLREQPRRVGMSFVLGIIGLVGAGNLSELGTTFADNILSLAVLTALVAGVWVLQSPENSGSKKHLIAGVCGVMLGAATGLKLTFAIYFIGVGAALILHLRPIFRNRTTALFIAGAGTAGFITFAPWASMMWSAFDNPIFPYMNHLFGSEWASDWPYRDLRYAPTSLSEMFLRPLAPLNDWRVLGERPLRDARLPFLTVSSGVLVASRFVRRATLRPELSFLGLASLLSVALWARGFSIYRYTVPLEMIAPVALWSTVLLWRGRMRKTWSIAVGALLLVTFWTTSFKSWRRTPWTGSSHLDVQMPAWSPSSDSLVVFLERTPMGYLSPQIPRDTPIVRLNAGSDPVRDPAFPGPPPTPTQLGLRVENLIANTDPEQIFVFVHRPRVINAAFQSYNLHVDERTCTKFNPRLEAQPIFRCQLIRRTQN